MKITASLIKHFGILVVIILLAGCSRKANEKRDEAQDSQPIKLSERDLDGTYEYSEPIEDSYLYFKIEIKKKGDSVVGRLWGGVYLAKSEVGGYTNPNVLTESILRGIIGDDTIEMQVTEIKTEIMEEEAPDLLGMMNFPATDAETSTTIWGFAFKDAALTSQNGLLMPDHVTPVEFVWEKIK